MSKFVSEEYHMYISVFEHNWISKFVYHINRMLTSDI